MKIEPTGNSERPQRPNEERKQGNDTGSIPIEKYDFNKTDSIEISKIGRQLAEEKKSVSSTNESGKVNTPAPAELPDLLSIRIDDPSEIEARADKIAQANERIESGYYNSPQVKNEIARRITDDFSG
ncbi:MAG: hypothetical protein KAR42_13030 [candidate division Zixibacteria bacterium]|nr:hypothetical protein [candidate division Zixibacteria bacterium]